MTYKWETVRVFISSTFRDMHAERDYLVKYVFPDIREWCEKWKLHLDDIDLRWGVAQAEAESGKVLDVCLEQIDACRPFFICILGNRYGSIPKPEKISPSTLKKYHKLKGKEEFSLTHLEIHHAVTEPLSSQEKEEPHAFFYFRDENSIPKPEEIKEFSNHECEEYRNAFFETDPSASARLTELKTSIQKHCDEPEKETKNADLGERFYFYSPTFDPSLINQEDDKLQGRLTQSSLKDFGEKVKKDLKKAISHKFHDRVASLSNKREEDALEADLDLHESFVENRTRPFSGRTELLIKLEEYVKNDSRHILAVYGKPGSGKSALLAKFYNDFKSTFQSLNSKALVIPHFVGATPDSTSLHSLLRRMCEELKAMHGIEDEIPTEVKKLPQTFKEFLLKVKKKTLILIDGLNQLDLSENALELIWLPEELPVNVKIIASTLEEEGNKALEKKTDNRLDVSPLTDDERKKIIRKMPSVFAKTLEDRHIEILLNKKETRNPLYLKVALEELRVFGSFEKLTEKVAEFPDNIIDLFVSVLKRLENDHKENYGIVERLFCLLECSRYGLTTKELRELLVVDEDNIHQVILKQIRGHLLNRGELTDFFHGSLSKAVQMKYLSKGESSHWHRVLAEYFQKKPLYLKDKKGAENKELPNKRKLFEQPWQQTKQGNMWDEMENTLTDVRFFEAKIVAGLSEELMLDFSRFNKSQEILKERSPEELASIQRCKIFGRALGNMIDFVRAEPASTGAQLHLELQSLVEQQDPEPLFRVEESCQEQQWLMRYRKVSQYTTPYLAQAGVEQTFLHFLHFSANGDTLLFADVYGRLVRWRWSDSFMTSTEIPAAKESKGFFRHGALLSDKYVVLASSKECWLLEMEDIWHSSLNQGKWRLIRETKEGYMLGRIVVSPAGYAIMAENSDKSGGLLRIDSSTGELSEFCSIPRLDVEFSVNDIALTIDGKLQALCSDTGALAVSTGMIVRVHTGGVTHIEFIHNDDVIATCGIDGSLAFWHVREGLLDRLELHNGEAECLAYCPQNNIIVVGHRSECLSLIQLSPDAKGSKVIYPGIRGWVLSLSFSPCGKYLAVGGRNGTVRIFDVMQLIKEKLSDFRQTPHGTAINAACFPKQDLCVFLDSEDHLYSTSKQTNTCLLPLHVSAWCVDHSRKLAVVALTGKFQWIDPQEGTVVYSKELKLPDSFSITISTDGHYLAALQYDELVVYHLDHPDGDWRQLFSIPASDLECGIDERCRTFRWRKHTPMLFCQKNKLLAVVVEPNVIAPKISESTIETLKMERKILLIDTSKGNVVHTIKYKGFCNALCECGLEGHLLVGLGQGRVYMADMPGNDITCKNGQYLNTGIDTGVRLYRLQDGKLIHEYPESGSNEGINAIATDKTGQTIASVYKNGRVRVGSIQNPHWCATVRLPDSAVAVQFTDRFSFWVGDNGFSSGNWPSEHHILLRLPVSNLNKSMDGEK